MLPSSTYLCSSMLSGHVGKGTGLVQTDLVSGPSPHWLRTRGKLLDLSETSVFSSFIQKYLLRIYYGPGLFLSPGDTAMN